MSFNTERQIVSQVKRQIHFMKFLKKNKRMQYDDVTSRSIGPNPRRHFLFFSSWFYFFSYRFKHFRCFHLARNGQFVRLHNELQSGGSPTQYSISSKNRGKANNNLSLSLNLSIYLDLFERRKQINRNL